MTNPAEQPSVANITEAVLQAGDAIGAAAQDMGRRHLDAAREALRGAGIVDAAVPLDAAAEGRDRITEAAGNARSSLGNYLEDIGARVTFAATSPGNQSAEHAAAHGTGPAHAELSLTGKVVVEERCLGDTPVTFALAKHTVANAPAIAQSVRHCDVLFVEGEGAKDNADRGAAGQLYALITSGSLGPESLSFIRERYSNHFGVQLVLNLESSGVMVVSAGMNEDNPDYALLRDFKDSAQRAHRDAYMAYGVDTLRADVRNHLEKAVAANRVRDALLGSQLRSLKERLASVKPDATIGVVLGAMHFPVVEVTEPANEGTTAPLEDRLRTLTTVADEAYMRQREGVAPSADTVDRIALGIYGEVLAGGYDGVDELTRKLKDYQLEWVMEDIDKLVEEYADPRERAIQVGAYIRSAVDVFVKKAGRD